MTSHLQYSWGRLVATMVVVAGVAATPVHGANLPWRAGVARVKITPEGPYWMGGYASRDRPSEGTRMDLYAKAIAIDDSSGSRVVMVTMDLLVIPRGLWQGVGKRVLKEHGLPRSQLFLNCSHTHSGPEVRLYREQVHSIPEVYAKKMRAYLQELETKLVQLVGASIANQVPAQLSFAQGVARFAVNRRNNKAADVPRLRREGKLQGPVDHAVPVLRVKTADGQVLAVLFGYACHNTTMGDYQTSGDYAGYAQRYIEEKHPGALAMFVMGAGGDQNPLPRRTVELLRQHGRSLADAVDEVLRKPFREVEGKLKSALANAPLEFQPHADTKTLQEQTRSRNQYERWKAHYILGELSAGRTVSRRYDLPVQALAFGDDLLLIGIGGETVVDYALRAKQQYERPGGPAVWVAGYSNDVFGYLPSRRVLLEGGYEGGGHMVYTKFPGPFTETVEKRVFGILDRLIEELGTARK